MICIYHSNCADGFTGAWVVRKALGDSTPITFYPGKYGDTNLPVVDGEDVLLVDFSYKRPVLTELRDRAKSITILDHHKTAEADLKDLPGIETVFDMNRSGARIAWDYFFPSVEPPQLLKHIEDRDLWRFALRSTREIQISVFSYPYEFAVWDHLMTCDLDLLAKEGETLDRKHFKDIREIIDQATRRMVIGGVNVPVVNLPYTMASDAGHILSKGEYFAASYYDTQNGRNFSLRSQPEGMDVSQIALMYGGGGHRNAAGFNVSFEVAKGFEL